MILRFNFKGSSLERGMESLSLKVGAAILMYVNTKAVETEAYMKQYRPWTDRTGMAKATLHTVVTQPSENIIRLTLAHGVWYGKYLELAHGQKYAIVKPTLMKKAPEIVRGLQNILEKVKVR